MVNQCNSDDIVIKACFKNCQESCNLHALIYYSIPTAGLARAVDICSSHFYPRLECSKAKLEVRYNGNICPYSSRDKNSGKTTSPRPMQPAFDCIPPHERSYKSYVVVPRPRSDLAIWEPDDIYTSSGRFLAARDYLRLAQSHDICNASDSDNDNISFARLRRYLHEHAAL